jgi:hypothetical protein
MSTYNFEFNSDRAEKLAVDRDAVGSGGSYAVIPGGVYTANLVKMTEEDWQDKKGFTQVNLKPEFTLFNDENTHINRQEWTLCTIDAKSRAPILRPDAKSVIWGTARGAAFLLQALGLYDVDGSKVKSKLLPSAIKNVIVRVNVRTGAYQKGGRELLPRELEALLTEQNLGAKYTDDQLADLLAAYNQDHATSYIAKNVIVGFYPVGSAEIKGRGFFLADNGLVFLDQTAAKEYEIALKAPAGNGSAPKKKAW